MTATQAMIRTDSRLALKVAWIAERVATINTLGDLPMTVLTAAHRSGDGLTPDELTRLDTIWRDGTERWAQLSTASNTVTVEDTGHAIQLEQPTVVISELLKLLPQPRSAHELVPTGRENKP